MTLEPAPHVERLQPPSALGALGKSTTVTEIARKKIGNYTSLYAKNLHIRYDHRVFLKVFILNILVLSDWIIPRARKPLGCQPCNQSRGSDSP